MITGYGSVFEVNRKVATNMSIEQKAKTIIRAPLLPNQGKEV